MGIIKKPTIWKKMSKKFKKNKRSVQDTEDLLDCKPLAKEIKDKAKKAKRKAVLKELGHRTLMICRYMGMGAALASPAHFTTSPSPYYPSSEPNYFRPDYPCYY